MKTVERTLLLMEQHNINKNKLSVNIGISSGEIGDWVAGRKQPSLKDAVKIAQYFNVSLDYLVGLSDEP